MLPHFLVGHSLAKVQANHSPKGQHNAQSPKPLGSMAQKLKDAQAQVKK